MSERELLTLEEAAERQVPALRRPQWADPRDRLEPLRLPGGEYGPWADLVSPGAPAIGIPERQRVLLAVLDWSERAWEEWSGSGDFAQVPGGDGR